MPDLKSRPGDNAFWVFVTEGLEVSKAANALGGEGSGNADAYLRQIAAW